MAYFIKPIEEERCASLSYEGDIPPREIAAAHMKHMDCSMPGVGADLCWTLPS